MSRRRSQRYFSEGEKEALLAALGNCRNAAVKACAAAPILGEIYNGCSVVMRCIDDLAFILTGDREYFWVKMKPSDLRPPPDTRN